MSCKKVTYQTREDAKYALKHLSDKKNHTHGKSSPLRYYFCTPCNGWHLTKKKKAIVPPKKTDLKYFNEWGKLLNKR